MAHCSALWIDHREARILHVRPDRMAPPQSLLRQRPERSDWVAPRPGEDDKRFFSEVARSLQTAEHVLVVGRSAAKVEFLKYVHEHGRALVPKIVGIATVPHPTDAQLAAYALKYFSVTDRVR